MGKNELIQFLNLTIRKRSREEKDDRVGNNGGCVTANIHKVFHRQVVSIKAELTGSS